MAFTGPAADRQAIREVMDAYSDAVFRHNAEDWIANWAQDGVWRMPGVDVTGRAAIKAAWVQAMSGFKLAGFFSAPGHIAVLGDQAEARSYTQEVLELHAGGVIRIIGTYDDTLVKQGGQWLFSSRRYRVLRQD